MYSDQLLEQQRDWASRALLLLRELLPLMSPVARHPEWTSEEQTTLGFLLSACARSSESALLLCAYGQLWDADVISRSVFEGTLKVMYLLQSPASFQQRHKEYAEDLFDIGLFKDHKKAEEFLRVIPNPDDKEWKPIRDMLISSEEISSIELRFSQSVRRALESKWGFTGLIAELSKPGEGQFFGASALCHGYSMSSHLMHADYIGVSMPLERDLRSQDRRMHVHLAHLVRLISDQLTCLQLRLFAGYRYIGHSMDTLKEASAKVERLHESFGNVYGCWMDIEYGKDEGGKN